MMSALPPVVTEATAFALSLTAIIGALALVSRLRPIRYVWRQLVSKPLAAWASSVIREGVLQFHLAEIAPQIEAIQKELTLNGGSTLRDEVVATRRVAEQALDISRWTATAAGIPLPGESD